MTTTPMSHLLPGHIPDSCAVASLAQADWLFVAALECPLSKVGAPASLLAHTVASCVARSNPSQWPLSLASELHTRLVVAPNREPDFGWGFFAAAAATRDRIVVCHAGDLRVHLLAEGAFAQVTRDHVVANEAAEWLANAYGDADLSMHRTVATRAIGQEPFRAEVTEWAGADELALFVCDADYHRHRAPAQYVGDALLATSASAGLAAWFTHTWR